MKNKIIFLTLVFLLSITMIYAQLPNIKVGDCVNIKIPLNASWVNISTLTYPNQTMLSLNVATTKVGGTFYYNDFCDTINGCYSYEFYDDTGYSSGNTFCVTPNGLAQTTAQGIGSFAYMLLILALTILFGWLGFKYLDSNYVWVIGIFCIFLSVLFIVYDVWLGYEYSLNFTGTGQANMAEAIFYVFLFLLVSGILTCLVLLFTKWKKIKEWYRRIKEEGEREEAEDDNNWR